jgi:DNA-damage-inducible protein J
VSKIKEKIVLARKQTSIKVDPIAWDSAKVIFKEYGISVSDAINIFLNKVRLEQGMPFDMKIPNSRLLNAMDEASTMQGEIQEINNKNILKKVFKDEL